MVTVLIQGQRRFGSYGIIVQSGETIDWFDFGFVVIAGAQIQHTDRSC